MSFEAQALPKQMLSFQMFSWFQRLVAIVCLVAGLQYWALISGLYGGVLWRFDLMPVHWQVAATSLAVLLPVAAVGLWMPVSWGPVIWFVAAGIEIVMYLGFPDLFGSGPGTIVLHCVVALIYIGFRLTLSWQKRRARRPVRVDSL